MLIIPSLLFELFFFFPLWRKTINQHLIISFFWIAYWNNQSINAFFLLDFGTMKKISTHLTADQSFNLRDGKSRGRHVAQFSYENEFKKIFQHLLMHYCATVQILLLVIQTVQLSNGFGECDTHFSILHNASLCIPFFIHTFRKIEIWKIKK